MRWKTKAMIQNMVARLPSGVSYSAYYWIQRNMGNLRAIDTNRILTGGATACKMLRNAGHDLIGKSVLEVGTGRAPIIPVALWLAGAERIVTVDLNPYMKEELVKESLCYIIKNRESVEEKFGSYIFKDRLDILLHYASQWGCLNEFLDLCCIDYVSPADAANLDIPSKSIDIHLSYTVYEHIPSNIIVNILSEGNRMVRDDGVFINAIDYFDHFWNSDKSISRINFLQYSDERWNRYAGNRYMYMNRLRHDDFIEIFRKVDHEVICEEIEKDCDIPQMLRSGNIVLDDAFKHKTEEVLSIISSWIVSRKKKQ